MNSFTKIETSFTSGRYFSVYHLCYYGIAAVLFVTGIAKIYDSSSLLAVLNQLPLLQETAIVLIATILPIVELSLAVALFLKWKPSLILSLVTALFTGFLGFSFYGIFTGLEGDCGCFGGVASSEFGWGMVVRNLILFLVASYLLVYNKYR